MRGRSMGKIGKVVALQAGASGKIGTVAAAPSDLHVGLWFLKLVEVRMCFCVFPGPGCSLSLFLPWSCVASHSQLEHA